MGPLWRREGSAICTEGGHDSKTTENDDQWILCATPGEVFGGEDGRADRGERLRLLATLTEIPAGYGEPGSLGSRSIEQIGC